MDTRIGSGGTAINQSVQKSLEHQLERLSQITKTADMNNDRLNRFDSRFTGVLLHGARETPPTGPQPPQPVPNGMIESIAAIIDQLDRSIVGVSNTIDHLDQQA